MGSWGHNAWQNDDAADLLAVTVVQLLKPIRQLLKSKENSLTAHRLYDKTRAACSMLVALGSASGMIDVEVFVECEQANLRAWRDKRWIEGFRDPKKVKRELTSELRAIQEQQKEWQ